MRREALADKTLSWFERLMNSPWCDRACGIVIGLSALYWIFGVVFKG